jgi:lysophospholipase L1-like esterase
VLGCGVVAATPLIGDYNNYTGKQVNDTYSYSGNPEFIHISLSNLSYIDSGNYANTSMYKYPLTEFIGVGSWGYASPLYTLLTINDCRIRQTGEIRYIKLNCAAASHLTEYRLMIWRESKSESGYYDLVYESPNLASQISDGINTVWLNDSSANIKEGDFIGEKINGTVGDQFKMTSAGEIASRFIPGSVSSHQNWGTANFLTGINVIDVYMKSPDVVFLGDSIFMGYPYHYGYIGVTANSNPNTTIESSFFNASNATYQNMGVYGDNTTQMRARFEKDVISIHPVSVIIEGGVNDVNQGISSNTTLDNIEYMILNAKDAGIDVYLLLILPWSAATQEQSDAINTLNEQYITLANEYGIQYIDLRPDVGTYNSGTLKWSIKSEYNYDNTHFNLAGNQKLGKEIFDKWANISINGNHWNSTANNPINITNSTTLTVKTNVPNMNADISIYVFDITKNKIYEFLNAVLNRLLNFRLHLCEVLTWQIS